MKHSSEADGQASDDLFDQYYSASAVKLGKRGLDNCDRHDDNEEQQATVESRSKRVRTSSHPDQPTPPLSTSGDDIIDRNNETRELADDDLESTIRNETHHMNVDDRQEELPTASRPRLQFNDDDMQEELPTASKPRLQFTDDDEEDDVKMQVQFDQKIPKQGALIHNSSRLQYHEDEDEEPIPRRQNIRSIVPEDEPPDFDMDGFNEEDLDEPAPPPPPKRPRVIQEEYDDELLGIPDEPTAQKPAALQRLPTRLTKSKYKPKTTTLPVASTKSNTINTILRKDYTYLPANIVSYVGGNATSGRRLYFPRKTMSEALAYSTTTTTTAHNVGPSKTGGRVGPLLSSNIYRLMDEIEAEQKAQALEESLQLPVVVKKPPLKPDAGTLWVDKYAPKKYIDLVGDERANREVLMWVKDWEFCVFGKPVRNRDAAKDGNKFGGRSAAQFQKFEEPPDRLKRPRKKILLLSGPPGLGKTTLAHVVAEHCGYRCVEINASDTRTEGALRNKLLHSIDSQSVMGDRRPNLVVIDEIDGASQASAGDATFMSFLTDLVTSTEGPKKQAFKKKKSAKPWVLQRPIICICNDMFSAVLRPLRMIAHMVMLPVPPVKPIARRLTDICRWEIIKIDTRALNLLVDTSEGDIRSCLHTLQFLQYQKLAQQEQHNKDKITVMDIQGLDVGHKDIRKGLFQVWDEVFCKNVGKQKLGGGRSKTTGHDLGMTMREEGVGAEGVSNTANLIDSQQTHHLIANIRSNGDYDKIMEGIFENYLRTRILDTTSSADTVGAPRSKIEEALEWMSFYDTMEHRVNRRQQWELSAYLPYPAVMFHRLFANARGLELTFPKRDYDNYIARRTHTDIIRAFEGALPPNFRQMWHSTHDIALLLRPMLTSILNIGDKNGIPRVADICASFGLRFAAEKLDDHGGLVNRLEPPIDILALPSHDSQRAVANDSSKRLLTGSSAMRTLANIEIEKALVRLRAPQPGFSPQAGLPPVLPKTYSRQRKEATLAAAAAIAPTTDFFGRVLISLPMDLDNMMDDAPMEVMKVRFRYNEGVSNAVRKVVKVRDFH
ncbi:hypothetical protein SmJEL517_g04811 [Synchytrium microbalum]|uniref:AAA+ ATPase domain-containing protein n=1 Tax=Synchytrium microbalum TaxID=1806994 RepID=A0A507BXX1_9FUNG|nr:uncharacterized protein SmJEL517_g04811 [Synchytrium microbalum]TPX31978.1 hypothetical protein SmJEL517_g04811 [Synchytrium microbalum]